MRALVAELGHPERSFRSVHVAGTNGKGSVVAMVDAALNAAGHRSARYTSPHLLDVSERFVVGNQPIGQAALEAAAADLRGGVDRLLARGRLQAPPTFFEATTAIAFELFRRAGAEIAVCEVGLGGRLDATNVLDPIVTAITTVGLDHQQYLGHSIAEVAREKAGIIKRGVPVVIGTLRPDALKVVTDVAGSVGAPLLAADPTILSAYAPVRLALQGAHQVANAAVAVRLLEEVDRQGIAVSTDAVRAGLERVVWPGRLEARHLPDGREILLDAAHNPDGAEALRAHLANTPPRPLVFAAMRDKDAAAMLAALAPAVSAFIMTRASNARSSEPSALAELARGIDPRVAVSVEPTAGAALAHGWRLSRTIVVAGSIFLLGDVINELNRA
jgi:dihydrofolate synthase/folylpolyglutamate synthase